MLTDEQKQEQFQNLALEQGIKILSKKRLTPKDFRRLEILTKIIFDVNAFHNQILSDRLAKSQFCGRAYRDQLSEETVKQWTKDAMNSSVENLSKNNHPLTHV